MQPRPADRATYLQGIFEGIARIEKQGYDLLEKLGADPVISIRSAGGGAMNPVFTRIRERILKRPLMKADNIDAAYGSALLAAGLV
jgi:sugar (pentulose or hexulose) kinase